MTAVPPTDPPTGAALRERRLDLRVLAALVLVVLAAWSWLAFSVHDMLVVGGENDGYLERAEALVQGRITADPFHPLGLPLLIAVPHALGVPAFVAGRAIVVAFGVLLVFATWRLVRCFASRTTATFAALAVAASHWVATSGVQVASDVPAAACVAMAVLCWTRAARPGEGRSARLLLFGGLWLGFAGSLRMPALAFAPALLPLLLARGLTLRQRGVRAAIAAAGILGGLLPHLVTRPWAGESLQNSLQIVWRYRFLNDYQGFLAFAKNPEPIPLGQWLEWLGIGLGDWAGYLTGTRGSEVLGSPWSGGSRVLGVVASLLATAAMVTGLVRWRRAVTVAALGAWSYSFVLCVMTVPGDRLTIPLAMPAVVLSVVAFGGDAARRARWPAQIAALLAAAAFWSLPRHLGDFERMHPRDEARVIRALAREHGDHILVAVPTIGVGRFVPCFVTYLALTLPEGSGPDAYWRELDRDPSSSGADFLVVAKRSTPVAFAAFSSPPPPGFRARLDGDDVLVIERLQDLGWLRSATLDWHGRDLELAVQIDPAVEAAGVYGVGYLVRQATGAWDPLSLLPVGGGRYALTVRNAARSVREGQLFVPTMIERTGHVKRGRPVAASAPPRDG